MPERIEFLRKKQKLSRSKFGKKLGKSGDAIYNLERGRSSIDSELIENLCKTFHVNENWFIKGEGDMYNISPESSKLSNTFNTIIDSEELSELVSKIVVLSPNKIKVLNDLVDIMHENEK
ncbi:helix-turn-helix domain-containing protein [Paraclostridium sordellii]|uniref:helix-turn-helix domain-containing protein n=1 Tax=Paraclostridium sordellii TaxID=1505 RepID=UPI001FAB1B0D|nr:helix-turn-helix transcriptional regulator [Paeniclostridium sordellii]